MHTRIMGVAVLVAGIAASSADAAVLHVPQDQPTIQAALDAALASDTILISDGTYSGAGNWDMEFGSLPVVLKSENGADHCIIDCGQAHRALTIRGLHDTATTIEGITFLDGKAKPVPDLGGARRGGALLCLDSASPLILKCVFRTCVAQSGGGGLASSNASPVVDSCVFDHCEAANQGGALNIHNAALFQTRNSRFLGNFTNTTNIGCALFSQDSVHSVAVLTHCLFEDNDALYGNVGCIASGVSSLTVEGCTFVGNRADGLTSTISASSCHIKNSYFENAVSGAPSVDQNALSMDSGSIEHSTFAKHRCQGAGAMLQLGKVDLVGVTLVDNRVDTLIRSNGTVNLDHVIVAHNLGSLSASAKTLSSLISGVTVLKLGTGIVQCSDMFGNAGGDWNGSLASFAAVNGNMTVDPLFCETDTGDYFLEDGSPCAPANSLCGQVGALPVNCAGSVLDSLWLEAQAPDHVVDHTPTFRWRTDGSLTLARMQLQVGNDSDWTFVENWDTGEFPAVDTFANYAGSALFDGQSYLARVRVGDSLYWSRWRPISFRMNSLPGHPMPVSPAQQEIVSTNAPAFSAVVAGDPEWDLQRLQFALLRIDSVVVDESPLLPMAPATAGDSVVWNSSLSLPENGSFIWAVRATDGFETTGYGATRMVHVDAVHEMPAARDLVAPVADTMVYTGHPRYTWARFSDPDPLDAVRYKLVLSTDSLFDFVAVVDSVADTSLSDFVSLELAHRYWWKVLGLDSHNLGATSGVATFRTYVPGDIDGSWSLNSGDIIALVNHVFKAETLQVPMCVAHTTGDDRVSANDIVWLVNTVFKSGPLPMAGCFDDPGVESHREFVSGAEVPGLDVSSPPVVSHDNKGPDEALLQPVRGHD